MFAAGELSRSEVSPSFVIMDSQNNPLAEAELGWCYASYQTLLMARPVYATKLPVVSESILEADVVTYSLEDYKDSCDQFEIILEK